MAHRFRGFCLGWRRAGLLEPLPHSIIQGRGARGAYGGSGFALRFTLQPLFLLRPCPAPCALKVAGESGLANRFGSFVCYRLELARLLTNDFALLFRYVNRHLVVVARPPCVGRVRTSRSTRIT